MKHLGLNGEIVLSKFYKGRTVLVTGHTGFKGTWLCCVLKELGANIIGYSLEPPTNPNLYEITKVDGDIISIIGDVRDYDGLFGTIGQYRPEIIIHMAAQPLVSVGYSNPRLTYDSNVMGTVNLLESARSTDCVKSIVNVTTDKVYLNDERGRGYLEEDVLNGYDPYSNSKSCSELVTSSYRKSFLDGKIAVSTARAGNVIGGGDFTDPRIMPDCVRAAFNNKPLILRNPQSTRPYQHVLEPICAYLIIAEKQFYNQKYVGSYNIGPNDDSCVDNESLVRIFNEEWGSGFEYIVKRDINAPHEANFLKLDYSKFHSVFGWEPIWNIREAVRRTIEWSKAYFTGSSNEVMGEQISEYLQMLRM